MKKMFLMAIVAAVAASVSFGGELEDCLNDCKAAKGGDVLAEIECLKVDCGHLKHYSNDGRYENDYTGGLLGYTDTSEVVNGLNTSSKTKKLQ